MVTPGDISSAWAWAKFTGKVASKLPGFGRPRRAFRYHATLATLRSLHRSVVHSARDLAFAIDMSDSLEIDSFSRHAMDFCSCCRTTMASLIRQDSDHLHCCLKMAVSDDNDEGLISTWVRSSPSDHRPKLPELGDAHPITGNTVWSSLVGENDGKTAWKPVRAFCSNDLPRHHDSGYFRCTRDGWQKYYRSALVLPLRVTYDAAYDGFVDLGYIAFDSPSVGAFPGMPDVIDLRDDLQTYHKIANEQPVFHLAATIADLTSMFLLEPLMSLNHDQKVADNHANEKQQLEDRGPAEEPASQEAEDDTEPDGS